MPAPPVLPSPRRSAWLAGAVVLQLLAFAPAGAQSNLSFLKNTPLAYFNEADSKMQRAATQEVLKSTEDGTRKDWANPDTGNGGTVTLVTSFSAPDGRACKQLSIENHTKTMANTTVLSVCKGTDGRWKADSAKPPQR
jgi:surface antigen